MLRYLGQPLAIKPTIQTPRPRTLLHGAFDITKVTITTQTSSRQNLRYHLGLQVLHRVFSLLKHMDMHLSPHGLHKVRKLAGTVPTRKQTQQISQPGPMIPSIHNTQRRRNSPCIHIINSSRRQRSHLHYPLRGRQRTKILRKAFKVGQTSNTQNSPLLTDMTRLRQIKMQTLLSLPLVAPQLPTIRQ